MLKYNRLIITVVLGRIITGPQHKLSKICSILVGLIGLIITRDSIPTVNYPKYHSLYVIIVNVLSYTINDVLSKFFFFFNKET